jgi:hypothetical protein
MMKRSNIVLREELCPALLEIENASARMLNMKTTLSRLADHLYAVFHDEDLPMKVRRSAEFVGTVLDWMAGLRLDAQDLEDASAFKRMIWIDRSKFSAFTSLDTAA